MELRGLSECIFVRCIERKKGGFYIEIVDSEYNKYRFYSRKKFDLEKGQKVIPILEVYSFEGKIRLRLKDLEGA